MRRGFKADAERLAPAVRGELGLGAHDRFEPVAYADLLGIPVLTLLDLVIFGAERRHVRHLSSDQADFSAATICYGTRKIIVFNQNHPPGRTVNSLAHELSHIILEHPAKPAIGAGGCLLWNKDHEDEADWLAGAILVPRDGAFHWLRSGADPRSVAQIFGVSASLFNWRMNQTGVRQQLIRMGLVGL